MLSAMLACENYMDLFTDAQTYIWLRCSLHTTLYLAKWKWHEWSCSWLVKLILTVCIVHVHHSWSSKCTPVSRRWVRNCFSLCCVDICLCPQLSAMLACESCADLWLTRSSCTDLQHVIVFTCTAQHMQLHVMWHGVFCSWLVKLIVTDTDHALSTSTTHTHVWYSFNTLISENCCLAGMQLLMPIRAKCK